MAMSCQAGAGKYAIEIAKDVGNRINACVKVFQATQRAIATIEPVVSGAFFLSIKVTVDR